MVQVLDSSGNWWRVKNIAGEKGFVPSVYLEELRSGNLPPPLPNVPPPSKRGKRVRYSPVYLSLPLGAPPAILNPDDLLMQLESSTAVFLDDGRLVPAPPMVPPPPPPSMPSNPKTNPIIYIQTPSGELVPKKLFLKKQAEAKLKKSRSRDSVRTNE